METFEPLFGVTQEDIQKIIASALSRGGDYADVFFEYSTSDELMLRDNEVNSVESSIDYGAGVRVLKEGRTGYAYSESTAMADLLRAARTASSIASEEAGETGRIEIKPLAFTNRYPVLRSWDLMPLAARREYLQKLNEMFTAGIPNISKVICHLAIDDSRIMFCNSLGDFFCDFRPCTTLSVSCI
ncbi:MAG: TldD/PmbA family protein, partial [Bacteroidales bacterium]|nr:TldD/PmbA family protein [Bacteroidales bacterium]